MNHLKLKNSQQKQVIDLGKIKPQIDGFEQDIYDPNLQIDVFDPYFYQVMITRFYFYTIPFSTSNSMIVQFYDNINFQSKAQEFFSIIKMPNQTDSNYKEALVKVFILTIFENIYNYLSNTLFLSHKYYFKYCNRNNDDFNNTFLKYFLCNSIYKDDFKNLVSSDDLDNLDNIEILTNEIIYLFPKNIAQSFNNIAFPNELEKVYILKSNILSKLNPNNNYCLEYYGPPPNYSEMNMKKIKVRYDTISSIYNSNCCRVFYSAFWNLLRKKTQIYQFRINNNLYQPLVESIYDDYIITRVVSKKISYDTYFENLDYYNQKLNGKLLNNLCNSVSNYYYTIIGYLIYKDNISQASSIIDNLTRSITKRRAKVFISVSLDLLSIKMNQDFINKQLNNKNAIFDLILEIIKKKLVIKITSKETNKLYRDLLQIFYNQSFFIEPLIKKSFIELCQHLNNKALSTI